MKRLLLVLAIVLAALPGASHGQMNSYFPGPGMAHTSSSLDPATTAWVSAVTTAGGSVSAGRQTVVNTFITCLKTASLWTTLDRYWLLAGENAGAAKVDMVNLQSFTVVNSPTFTANVGYQGVSAGNYINTNFTASGSTLCLQNSCTFGGQIQTNRTVSTNDPVFGASDAGFTNVTVLNPLVAGGSEVRINASGANGDVGSTSRGSWIASRTGSSAGQLYYNGGTSFPGATITQPSTGFPGTSMYILAFNQGGSPGAYDPDDQVSSFFVGGGWNGTQATAFESCQNAMMTSLSINVH